MKPPADAIVWPASTTAAEAVRLRVTAARLRATQPYAEYLPLESDLEMASVTESFRTLSELKSASATTRTSVPGSR